MKLSYQDDTPIQDESGVVIVRHGFSHNQELYNRTEYPVPRNGILELNFYPPNDENIYTLGIEVTAAISNDRIRTQPNLTNYGQLLGSIRGLS